MCLAKAYLSEDGGEDLVMEDVALLRIKGKKLLLNSLFGEQKEIEGLIKEVNFQNSKLVIEKLA